MKTFHHQRCATCACGAFATRMAHRLQRLFLFVLHLAVCASPAFAQTLQWAPGEDPITISRRVAPPMGPALAQAKSSPMAPPPVAPAWLEAKVARLEAKAWAFDSGNVITDKNLLAAASSDGLRKVCVQDIGSSLATSANATGAGNSALRSSEPQIVVLKGDLVNICR